MNEDERRRRRRDRDLIPQSLEDEEEEVTRGRRDPSLLKFDARIVAGSKVDEKEEEEAEKELEEEGVGKEE